MDANRFDTLTRSLTDALSRRKLLRGFAATAGLGLAVGHSLQMTGAKKKKRKKSKQDLCLSNGSPCKKQGKKCKAGNCLQLPFTIEARWTNPNPDHDTYLFVPNEPGAALPSPYLDYGCRSSNAGAGFVYPFAYVSQDAKGPGDEITTVAFLLDGKHEYWIALDSESPAGDVTVDLRNKNGQVVRTWSSPGNSSTQSSWHVFDIQGERRSVTSIDRPISGFLPRVAHDPSSRVCP